MYLHTIRENALGQDTSEPQPWRLPVKPVSSKT